MIQVKHLLNNLSGLKGGPELGQNLFPDSLSYFCSFRIDCAFLLCITSAAIRPGKAMSTTTGRKNGFASFNSL
jgi:hypothetical protein